MKYLLDTNIFLEILLAQTKEQVCKDFIQQNIADCALTDFSLHSIGVITFRQKKPDLFEQFCSEVLGHMALLSLPPVLFKILSEAHQHGLDFDDAYQFAASKANLLTIVTMDADFKRVEHLMPLLFL
jgi:uncharacterized protein